MGQQDRKKLNDNLLHDSNKGIEANMKAEVPKDIKKKVLSNCSNYSLMAKSAPVLLLFTF